MGLSAEGPSPPVTRSRYAAMNGHSELVKGARRSVLASLIAIWSMAGSGP
jgi:hypothetical protein